MEEGKNTIVKHKWPFWSSEGTADKDPRDAGGETEKGRWLAVRQGKGWV